MKRAASRNGLPKIKVLSRSEGFALLLHYPLLLLLCTVGALVPYMLPSEVTVSIPRAAIVSWYAVIALAAGFCGITWILRTALLTRKTPRETDIRLQGDTEASPRGPFTS